VAYGQGKCAADSDRRAVLLAEITQACIRAKNNSCLGDQRKSNAIGIHLGLCDQPKVDERDREDFVNLSSARRSSVTGAKGSPFTHAGKLCGWKLARQITCEGKGEKPARKSVLLAANEADQRREGGTRDTHDWGLEELPWAHPQTATELFCWGETAT